jgi:hypothetical protein
MNKTAEIIIVALLLIVALPILFRMPLTVKPKPKAK